jgi:NSS family neurotransmitter:Na+ symporter
MRTRAVWYIGGIAFLAGAPSAVSLSVFENQDWVWGLGLLLSGAFFTFTVWRIRVSVFIKDWLQVRRHETLLKFVFSFLFYFLIPVEFFAMLGWWSIQSIQWNPGNWWNPSEIFGLGTAILQWSVIIALGLILNKPINRRLETNNGR